MNAWFAEHMGITYILIVVLVVYVYNKVFRVRKLPLLKEAVVYVLIAIGSFLLLIFQIDANLPILQCLLIAVAMMIVYRLRVAYLNRKQPKGEDNGKEG